MKPLPKKAAKEAQAAYIERVFKHLYGNQKRVKPTKAVDNGVHRSA